MKLSRFEVLSQKEIEMIHKASLDVLENCGVKILSDRVMDLLEQKGWRVGNVDATVIAQRPKLAGFIPAMRDNLAARMKVRAEQVNVKATTEEKLGFTGAGEGIAVHAVVLLESI